MAVQSSLRCIPLLCFCLSLAGMGEGTPGFPQSVASGDPKADSVILWTRTDLAGADREVNLSLTPEDNLGLVGSGGMLVGENLYRGSSPVARVEHDGCVKVRVTGLEPDRYYFYQFSYREGGTTHRSAVGRTRTAPGTEEDAVVRFAVLNCSDYSGRYFNTLRHLALEGEDDLHFILHLGDYIYETIGDPRFQTPVGQRWIGFTDPGGALQLGGFLGARSLSNYRDLYRTYRQDPQLMRAHELFPWVVIWDDHEFSDDHHGATANYFDGAVDETDVERKRNAERAWMEYIPADVGLGEEGLSIGEADLYPHTRIYRSLNFGRNLDLVLTDNRTHRSDHLVPEDAWPGTVLMGEEETRGVVESLFGAGTFPFLRFQFDPYLDIAGDHPYFGREGARAGDAVPEFAGTPLEGLTFAQALIALTRQAVASELADLPEGQVPAVSPGDHAARVVTGNISATWINTVFRTAGLPEPVDESLMSTLPRGIPVHNVGSKFRNFDEVGSRYLMVDAAFRLYSLHLHTLHLRSEGALGHGQELYGAAQREFILGALQQSVQGGRSWRVVASSVPFVPMHVHMGDVPEDFPLPAAGVIRGEATPEIIVPQGIPENLRIGLLINADEISGFPASRLGWLDALVGTDAVIVSGDIHASMLGVNAASNGERAVEFTAPPSSSSALRSGLSRALEIIEDLVGEEYRHNLGDPTLEFSYLGREEMLSRIDELILHNSKELEYLNSRTQGYLVIEAGPESLTGEFREIGVGNVRLDRGGEGLGALDALFTRRGYRVTRADGDLMVSALPVRLALAGRDIRAGEFLVLPAIGTEEGTHYRVLHAGEVDADRWQPLPEADYVAVDGALMEEGTIVGNGNRITVVFRIPEALSGASRAFFRVAPIPPDQS